MLFDTYALKVINANTNMLVPWWIMGAWAYDVANTPILSDAAFDEIAVRLQDNWVFVQHRHKSLLDPFMLTSAIAISGRWPPMAIHAAQRLIRDKRIIEVPQSRPFSDYVLKDTS